MSNSSKSAALRRLFASPSPIVVAGTHDGLSARLDPSTLERDVEALTRTMRETNKPVALVV
jgi:hypothetical protein